MRSIAADDSRTDGKAGARITTTFRVAISERDGTMPAVLDREDNSHSSECLIMKRCRRLMRPTLFAVLGASLLSQSAFAQFSSNTATRTTTGGTGTTGTGASANSTGTSGASGTSGGMFGRSQGASSSGLGQTGQAGNAQGRQINTQSQLGLNQDGFLGQGNSQQNFVGRNQGQNNSQNRQNNNNRGGQGNFGQNDNNQNGQGQQNQDPKRAIRPQLRVAFDELPRPTTEIRSTLQPRFDSLSQVPSLRGVAYELDAEGVVVLRGTVDTPSQRRLAENVVKLEPGVKKVRNELTLNEPAATK